jgi:hypothetical protein
MKSSVPKKEGPRAKTGGPSAAKVQAVTQGGPPKEIDEDTTIHFLECLTARNFTLQHLPHEFMTTAMVVQS